MYFKNLQLKEGGRERGRPSHRPYLHRKELQVGEKRVPTSENYSILTRRIWKERRVGERSEKSLVLEKSRFSTYVSLEKDPKSPCSGESMREKYTPMRYLLCNMCAGYDPKLLNITWTWKWARTSPKRYPLAKFWAKVSGSVEEILLYNSAFPSLPLPFSCPPPSFVKECAFLQCAFHILRKPTCTSAEANILIEPAAEDGSHFGLPRKYPVLP